MVGYGSAGDDIQELLKIIDKLREESVSRGKLVANKEQTQNNLATVCTALDTDRLRHCYISYVFVLKETVDAGDFDEETAQEIGDLVYQQLKKAKELEKR